MQKLLIGLAITIATLTPFKANSRPVSNVNCESYGMRSEQLFLTQDYRFYLCRDSNENHYYLGGMRKGNADHYTLLPVSGYGDGYVFIHNQDYTYMIAPACGPSDILDPCYPAQPEMFYIQKGNTVLDKQVIGATATYE